MKLFFTQLFLLVFSLVPLNSFGANLFVSLKSSEVNLRVGPGKEYPVSYVIMKANLPVILLAEFDQWRKIKLIDETSGWVHKNMISHRASAIVLDENTIMYKHASTKFPIAKVEKDVVLRVVKRDGDWIKVDINNQKGWVKKNCLWGINEEQ